MNNLINVQKFSTTNTKQTFDKKNLQLKETKYNWFTSIVLKVANKIAQLFGVKTITQQNLSSSIQHAGHYVKNNDIDIEVACEIKSTISQIKQTFNNYLRSNNGHDDLLHLDDLEKNVMFIINIKLIEDYNIEDEDMALNKLLEKTKVRTFNNFAPDDYLLDEEIDKILDNSIDNKTQTKERKFSYFLEGNSEGEIRLKTKIYK